MRSRLSYRVSPEQPLTWVFGALLLTRLLYPYFSSPLEHLFSDPARHWDNGGRFLQATLMGSSDPYLYQLWVFALRQLSGDSPPWVLLATGLLCAAMPYGWYRTLRALQSKPRALIGAALIGLVPESLGMYAYFMNETLLMTLLGFCFWATLRAQRKGTLGAFALACALWLAAAFTRTVALPMALGCLGLLWLRGSGKVARAAVFALIAVLLAAPAGLHARAKLGFFAPFGNLYFNEIYRVSGHKEIAADYGPDGQYGFGCPSFYNAAFYPWSDWMTDRTGKVSIQVDLPRGRAGWIAERERVARERTFPAWRERWEDFLYLLFGQPWPVTDLNSVVGWLAVWTRWLWPPILGAVGWAVVRRRYQGMAWLLPACALGCFALLAVQSEGVMEARYRMPIDALLLCAAWLALGRARPAAPPLPPVTPTPVTPTGTARP